MHRNLYTTCKDHNIINCVRTHNVKCQPCIAIKVAKTPHFHAEVVICLCQEVLGINMSHTRVMGWWGVGRLNKNFGGQVFFGSDFDFEGLCSLVLLCFVLLHFQFGALRAGLRPEGYEAQQYPHMAFKTSEIRSSVPSCLILHCSAVLLNSNGGEFFYNKLGGACLTTLYCIVL